MSQIILTAEQAKALREAPDVVEFVDEEGHSIGAFKVTKFSPERLAEAKQRGASPGPWIPADEVMRNLNALSQK